MKLKPNFVVAELSKAVGKTTKRVVTRSRSVGRNRFAGRSMSERTEETAFLPEDEARRMDLDDIVLVVDAQRRAMTARAFGVPRGRSSAIQDSARAQ